MTVTTHSFRAFFVILALCFVTTPVASAATVTVDFRGDGDYDYTSRTGVPFKVADAIIGNITLDGIDGPPLLGRGIPVTQSALGLGAWGIDDTPDDTRKVETRVDLGEELLLGFIGPGPRPFYAGVRNIVINFSFTSVLGDDPFNTDLLTVRSFGTTGLIAEQTFKYGSFFLSLELPDIFNTEDTEGLMLSSTAESAFIVESIRFSIVPVPAGLLLSTSSLLLLAPFALSRRRRKNTGSEITTINGGSKCSD